MDKIYEIAFNYVVLNIGSVLYVWLRWRLAGYFRTTYNLKDHILWKTVRLDLQATFLVVAILIAVI